MAHPTLGEVLLVANPRAGTGTRGAAERTAQLLAGRGIVARTVVTAGPGDATSIARDAAAAGVGLIVAVGGDGTVHEVVNGLPLGLAADRPGPVLGVVPAGSGCDLVRTFGLDRPPEVLVDHLASPHTTALDLIEVVARTEDGAPVRRVAANVVEVGFGGTVATVAARLPRRLGPARYRVGIVAAWGAFRRVPMRVDHAGGRHEDLLCNVVVANGQFFGGGLHVAPRALPDDGALDLQTWGGSPTDVVRAARLLRTGAHLGRPDVRSWRTASVRVDAERPVRVEADGEPVGWSPVTCTVLPAAVRLKV
jgi:diacylglycerol kinase (ATP)